VAHPHGLRDAESASIVALQEGAPAPGPHDPVWIALRGMGPVWLDEQITPGHDPAHRAGANTE
jgi:hypothetical protein